MPQIRESSVKIVDSRVEQKLRIFKQNAGMQHNVVIVQFKIMSDVFWIMQIDLTDLFSTVKGVGRVRLGGERRCSRVWLDQFLWRSTTQEIEEAFLKEMLNFSWRIESKDIDLTIQLDNIKKWKLQAPLKELKMDQYYLRWCHE